MADILIRGMEMPKTCSQCPMCQDYVMCKLNSFAFWNTNNPFDFRHERLAGCPLVELPEHGDLISREEALSMPFANGKYDHENADEHFIYGCETYKEWLEQLPVVISSNKEDTK